MEKDVKILAFVGMSGSGKTAATEYVVEKWGVPKIYFGGIMHRAMEEEGWEVSSEGDIKYPPLLRAKYGKDFVAKRAIQSITGLIGAGQKRIVLDGLYSWAEYKALKHEFPGEIIVVAMVPTKKERHKRLAGRGEREYDKEGANARDWSEIENAEKGGPIAAADYFIVNDGAKEETQGEVDRVLGEIGF